MRSINPTMSLWALVGALLGLLLPGAAAAESCSDDKRGQVVDLLDVPFAFPIGVRLVVSNHWSDRPTRVGDGERRITNAVYDALLKLKESRAVTVTEADRTAENGWVSDEAMIKRGIFKPVAVEPDGIRSEPTYRLRGDYFTVRKFAYSNLRIGSSSELKSPTDRYCLMQFTFTATFNPMLKPLFDTPETASRRARLLNKWDPFERKWRFVAFDHEPQQDGDFGQNNVGKAVQTLSLAR
jgi:hypothetical protein